MPQASKHRDENLPAELYHYTNWSGLRGIIETQSLWATRYNHLNDATEVEHFRDLITDALADKIKPILREIRGSKFSSRRAFDKAGGLLAIARNDAQALVDSIYQASFTGHPGGTPFAVPYITSFCSHANDHAYERANGLLSQWRGYGSESNGRYAIVFDRGRLLSLLKRESDHFDYPHLQMCKVVYNTNPLAEDFSSMFSSIVDTLSKVLRKHITEEDSAVAAMSNVLMDFLSATTRFKHRGFQEEREIRIVASPKSDELNAKFIADLGKDTATTKMIKSKQTRQHPDGLKEIEYLSLFASLPSAYLPINKVIVGPHREQRTLRKRVQSLVGQHVSVQCSETPYID